MKISKELIEQMIMEELETLSEFKVNISDKDIDHGRFGDMLKDKLGFTQTGPGKASDIAKAAGKPGMSGSTADRNQTYKDARAAIKSLRDLDTTAGQSTLSDFDAQKA